MNSGAQSPTELERKRCDNGGSAKSSRRFCVYTNIAPLIRGRRPTDQRIAGDGIRKVPSRPRKGSHLNNWIEVGRLKIFNFAELCARYIPDPERTLRVRFRRIPFGLSPGVSVIGF